MTIAVDIELGNWQARWEELQELAHDHHVNLPADLVATMERRTAVEALRPTGRIELGADIAAMLARLDPETMVARWSQVCADAAERSAAQSLYGQLHDASAQATLAGVAKATAEVTAAFRPIFDRAACQFAEAVSGWPPDLNLADPKAMVHEVVAGQKVVRALRAAGVITRVADACLGTLPADDRWQILDTIESRRLLGFANPPEVERLGADRPLSEDEKNGRARVLHVVKVTDDEDDLATLFAACRTDGWQIALAADRAELEGRAGRLQLIGQQCGTRRCRVSS